MKRWIGLLLALGLLLSGCADLQPPAETGSNTTNPSVTTEATEPSATEATEAPTTEATAPTSAEATEPVSPGVSGDIQITEVMADDRLLSLGRDRDWVELYNRSDAEVKLTGFYLTDDPAKPEQLSLDGNTIPAGGYLVVELGEDAPFNLSSKGESVYLFSQGTTYDSVTFGESKDGASFCKDGICRYVTPGYGDTEEGYRAALEARYMPRVIISEVMASNSRLPAPDGGCHDWVEVQNISKEPLSLSGYALTDKHSEPERYAFPDVSLQPGECYVVYCSGNTALGKNHASFKISASGETLYLSENGVYSDALKVPGDVGENQSYGRNGKIPVYLTSPTPGKANSDGGSTALSAPTANMPSGLYPETVYITLKGEGTIYYTIDGSCPTVNSKVYAKPLMVSGATTIRTFCVSGSRTSAMTAYTYVVGAKHDLPVVCVAMPQSSLTGDQGVLNHIDEDYEQPGMVTLIENGEEKFSVPFGFRLHGNDSRKMDKQNFQLRFRSEYGASKLKYPLFPDRDIDEYNSLLLKGGSEDWNVTMLRDEFCTELVNGTTKLYTQAIKPVVLYLGGQYWGVYYLRERVNDDYVADHLGVSTESVDLLYSTFASVQKGSDKDFNALKKYVETHDMSQKEHYEYLAARIDVDSLMDWYICRSFVGDMDLANIRRFRSSEADGKWHWVYFDLDWAMYHFDAPSLTRQLSNRNGEPLLMKALLKSPQGRDRFLKRCNELYQTVFTEEHVNKVLDGLVSQIQSEMPRDRERWGCDPERWDKAIQTIRDFFADGKRLAIMKADIQDYFNLSNAEMAKYFG